jgi:hypothetical protein
MEIEIRLTKKRLIELNKFLRRKKIPIEVETELKLFAHISILHDNSIIKMLNHLLTMFNVKYKYYICTSNTCYKLHRTSLQQGIEEKKDIKVKIDKLYIPRFVTLKKKGNIVIELINGLFGLVVTNYNEKLSLIHNANKRIQIIFCNIRHEWDGKIISVTESLECVLFVINKKLSPQNFFYSNAKVEESKIIEEAKIEEAKVEESKIIEEAKIEEAKAEESKVEEATIKEEERAEEAKIEEAKFTYIDKIPGINTLYLWKQSTILNPSICRVKQNIL